jgi:hypothetical protein
VKIKTRIWVAVLGLGCFVAPAPVRASLTLDLSPGGSTTQPAWIADLLNQNDGNEVSGGARNGAVVSPESTAAILEDLVQSGKLNAMDGTTEGLLSALSGASTSPEGTITANSIKLPIPAVPEPTTAISGVMLLVPFGIGVLRRLRRNVST